MLPGSSFLALVVLVGVTVSLDVNLDTKDLSYRNINAKNRVVREPQVSVGFASSTAAFSAVAATVTSSATSLAFNVAISTASSTTAADASSAVQTSSTSTAAASAATSSSSKSFSSTPTTTTVMIVTSNISCDSLGTISESDQPTTSVGSPLESVYVIANSQSFTAEVVSDVLTPFNSTWSVDNGTYTTTPSYASSQVTSSINYKSSANRDEGTSSLLLLLLSVPIGVSFGLFV